KAESYLDAGNDGSLDAAGDFTVDIQFQLDKTASGAQALLSKGTLGSGKHVPYSVYLNSEMRPVFSCEDQYGNLFTCGAFKTVQTGTPVRLTVTRQRRSFSVLKGKSADRAVDSTSDFYDLRFYIDGQDAGQPPLLPPKQPSPNVEPDDIYKDWTGYALMDEWSESILKKIGERIGTNVTNRGEASWYLLTDPASKPKDLSAGRSMKTDANFDELNRCYKRRWYLKLKDDD